MPCGGGSGLLGFLQPKSAAAPNPPKVQTPAPPAPERKQDTGAIVAIGNDDSDSELRARSAMARQKGGSALGAFGKVSPLL